MKKPLTIILFILLSASFAFGPSLMAQVKLEWREVLDELNSAVRQFGLVAPARAAGDQ